MKLSSILCLLPYAAATSVHPTAVLKSGPIFGIQTNLPDAIAPVNKFLGVPFASPPRRFGLAKPPSKWVAPRNATVFSASCLVSGAPLSLTPGGAVLAGLQPRQPQSEDCLYVNVFSPATPGPPSGRPIVLFLPGGGFQAGSGIIDFSGFAAYEDIIAMGINYRNNIFGFPNSPDIPVSERNLGLHDQRLALSWVHANAASFGGDPSKVTIWGGSAGSFSVSLHVQAYADVSPPPFRAGILSSGQAAFGQLATLPSSPNDYQLWNAVSNAVGCINSTNNLRCMRDVPASTIQQALFDTKSAFVPLRDNLTVPAAPATAWKTGKVSKVPLLNTNVAQEGRALIDQSMTLAQFTSSFLGPPFVTDNDKDAILSYYAQDPNLKTEFDTIAAVYTDMLWVCPQTLLSEHASSNGISSWRYHFNASLTPLLPEQYSWLGAFHGSDVMLVTLSPTFENGAVPGMTGELYALANYLRGTIAGFVKNPNGGVQWPAFGSTFSPSDVAVLGNGSTVASAGIAIRDHAEVYKACHLYKSIYDAIEAVTL